ncbi:MAG: hypothetical protein KKE46_03125 [Gammaproteobacteria bacterium]|nr:hypothetical protein [Gammaproteobacteria bacterium]
MGKTDSITFEYHPDGKRTPSALPYDVTRPGVFGNPSAFLNMDEQYKKIDENKLIHKINSILSLASEETENFWNKEGFGDLGRQKQATLTSSKLPEKTRAALKERFYTAASSSKAGLEIYKENTNIEEMLFKSKNKVSPQKILKEYLSCIGIDYKQNLNSKKLWEKIKQSGSLPLLYEALFFFNQNVTFYVGINDLTYYLTSQDPFLTCPISSNIELGVIIEPLKNKKGFNLSLLYEIHEPNEEGEPRKIAATIETNIEIEMNEDKLQRKVTAHQFSINPSIWSPYFLRFASHYSEKKLFQETPEKLHRLIQRYNKKHPNAPLPSILMNFTIGDYVKLKGQKALKSFKDNDLEMFSLADQLSFVPSSLTSKEANTVVEYVTKNPQTLLLTGQDQKHSYQTFARIFSLYFRASNAKTRKGCITKLEKLRTDRPEWYVLVWCESSETIIKDRKNDFLDSLKKIHDVSIIWEKIEGKKNPEISDILEVIETPHLRKKLPSMFSRPWLPFRVKVFSNGKFLSITKRPNYIEILKKGSNEDFQKMILLSNHSFLMKLLCNKSSREAVTKALFLLSSDLFSELETIKKESNKEKRIKKSETLDTQAELLIAFTERFEKRALEQKQAQAVIKIKEQLKTVKETVKETVETEELIEKDKKEILEIETALRTCEPSVIKELKLEKTATHPLLDDNANPFKKIFESFDAEVVDSTEIFRSLMKDKKQKWEKPDLASNSDKEDRALLSEPPTDSNYSSSDEGNSALLSEPLTDSSSSSRRSSISSATSGDDLLREQKDAVNSADISEQLLEGKKTETLSLLDQVSGYETDDSYAESDTNDDEAILPKTTEKQKNHSSFKSLFPEKTSEQNDFDHPLLLQP